MYKKKNIVLIKVMAGHREINFVTIITLQMFIVK